MKIVIAKTAGFCYGVNRAVNIVNDSVEKYSNLVTLGPLIHNPDVVRDFEKRGVTCINSIDEIEENMTVVLRTHGVNKQTIDFLSQKNCKIIDATCPFVKKIHNYVEKYYKRGYNIIVVGDKHHPEVEGILGWCENAYVINDPEKIDLLKITKSKICVVSQTTFEQSVWKRITEKILSANPSAEILNTICNATEERQNEISKISSEVEAVIVIGGKNSSNTKRLADVASGNCSNVYLIENSDDLNIEDMRRFKTIGITAGASTPAYIIKEVAKMLEEKDLNFEEALNETLKPINTGETVKGTIIKVTQSEAYVDLGAKADGIIPADQATLEPNPELEKILSVGQEVEAFVVRVNDKDGYITLSLKKLQLNAAQKQIQEAFDNGEKVKGIVTDVIKGGIIVTVFGSRVFVPASLASDNRNTDLNTLMNKEVTLKLIDMDRRRRKLVGSIKAVLNEEKKAKKEAFWASVEVGMEIKGVVKSVTSFGAFVDIGGVDGLVHVSELSWDSFKKPSELVKPGDIIDVKILEFDKETGKVSLGHKKAEDNPWIKIKENYNVNDVIECKVVRLLPFGAFAEIIPGVDGLIHISQISNKKIGKPADVLNIGDVVNAKIVEINLEDQKIALSIRALEEPVAEEVKEESEPAVETVEEVAEEAPVTEEE